MFQHSEIYSIPRWRQEVESTYLGTYRRVNNFLYFIDLEDGWSRVNYCCHLQPTLHLGTLRSNLIGVHSTVRSLRRLNISSRVRILKWPFHMNFAPRISFVYPSEVKDGVRYRVMDRIKGEIKTREKKKTGKKIEAEDEINEYESGICIGNSRYFRLLTVCTEASKYVNWLHSNKYT